MDTKVIPSIGDKVVAKFLPYTTGTLSDTEHEYTGQTIIVSEVAENYWCPDSEGINGYRVAVCGKFTSNTGYQPYHYVTEWDAVIEEIAAPPEEIAYSPTITVEQYNEAIARACNAEEVTANLQRTLDEVRRDACNAMNVISERVNTESYNRDWCGIFDDIIDDVNGSLPRWLQLEKRERDWDLAGDFLIRIRLTGSYPGRTLTEACETAGEMEADHMIQEAIRYGNYEIESAEWDED
jgi:hypothetical protein